MKTLFKPTISVCPRLAGRIRMVARKVDEAGEVIEDAPERVLADWFDNLILDQGLERIGIDDYMTACQVGSSSTAPSELQTALVSFIAGTTDIHSQTSGAEGTEPYFGWIRRTYRFAVGTAAGNISEIGIGWASSGAFLFSRALAKDEFGDPTTVTVFSDEVLDVTYELRAYPPLADGTPSVIAVNSVNHTLTPRAMNVTDSNYWAPNGVEASPKNVSSTLFPRAYNGAIGAITAAPAGTPAQRTSVTSETYSGGSLQRDMTGVWELDDGNLAGGITAFAFVTTLGSYQVSVSPALPKTNEYKLTWGVRLSWARYVP